MGNRGFFEGGRTLSDTKETRTDKFRIVPHTPFVYRIERLYLLEVTKTETGKSIFKTTDKTSKEAEEIWKNYGYDQTYGLSGAPTLPHSFSSNFVGGAYWNRIVEVYPDVDSAKKEIDKILSEEKKREKFMNQGVIYYGE